MNRALHRTMTLKNRLQKVFSKDIISIDIALYDCSKNVLADSRDIGVYDGDWDFRTCEAGSHGRRDVASKSCLWVFGIGKVCQVSKLENDVALCIRL